MNRTNARLLVLLVAAPASAQPFTIRWSTVDGGGGDSSVGGPFTLSGTIGQHDAGGPVTRGDFALTGGFWSPRFADSCLADFNGDNQVDFFDYLDFVQAFADEAPSADFNRNGTIDFFDYLDFVAEFDAGC